MFEHLLSAEATCQLQGGIPLPAHNKPFLRQLALLETQSRDMVMATAILESHNQNVNHVSMKKPLLADYRHHHALVDAKKLVGDALHQRVESVDHELCEPGDEDTFYVADLGEVYRQHLRWKKNLPRVKPFYGEDPTPPPFYFSFFVCVRACVRVVYQPANRLLQLSSAILTLKFSVS